jgi:hypothetical protein
MSSFVKRKSVCNSQGYKSWFLPRSNQNVTTLFYEFLCVNIGWRWFWT